MRSDHTRGGRRLLTNFVLTAGRDLIFLHLPQAVWLTITGLMALKLRKLKVTDALSADHISGDWAGVDNLHLPSFVLTELDQSSSLFTDEIRCTGGKVPYRSSRRLWTARQSNFASLRNLATRIAATWGRRRLVHAVTGKAATTTRTLYMFLGSTMKACHATCCLRWRCEILMVLRKLLVVDDVVPPTPQLVLLNSQLHWVCRICSQACFGNSYRFRQVL